MPVRSFDTVFFLATRSKRTIFSPPEKVSAIENFPEPDTVKRLREFLFLRNFYRRFIPRSATILHPLTEMLMKPHAQTTTLNCATVTTEAFLEVNADLAASTILAHPQEGAPTNIMVNAS